MSRKNQQNIQKYNDKLHQKQAKAKMQKVARKAQLKAILDKFHSEQKPKDTE